MCISGKDVLHVFWTVRPGAEKGTYEAVDSRGGIERVRFSLVGNKATLAFGDKGAECPADLTPRQGVATFELELVGG